MYKDIRLEDCLDLLRSLEDKSVEFAFYDPPYNVGKDYGVHKDNLGPDEYADWMEAVAGHVYRITRRGMAVFVSSQLNSLFFEFLPEARLIPIVKRAAGIVKDNIAMQYYSLFVVGTPLIKCSDVWEDIRLPGEGYFFKEERFGHPGQTSMALVKKVLRHFTKPGDSVLDPFLGVGTSAIAALSMGRSIIGSENNPAYFEIMTKRIQDLEAQEIMIPPAPEEWRAGSLFDDGDKK
jgi:DNA modification methylase